jgi:coenzyme F420 hydrogenase subunit beta
MRDRVATLAGVVGGGLCTGCGICESMAGRDRVEMQLSAAGQLRPRIHAPLAGEEEAAILDVCPGLTALGPGSRPAESGTTIDPVWGPLRRIRRGWAADPAIRHRSAAGGALTALACFLLDSGRVDAVIHVRASATEPMQTDALVSRTAAEAMSGAQSRYGPAAPLVHVHRLLEEGLRLAVVAKPCDVAAIRNLARRDARVATQVPYLLTLFCGGVPTIHTAERIAAYHGLTSDEVAVFRWRGEGWPGPTHVESHDGRAFDLTYDEAWFDAAKPWRYAVQWRCKICPDAIGELADVSCPDGWVLDGAGRALHDEAPGVNAIVERTAAGSELIDAAAAAGYLQLAPLDRAEFEGMHRDHRNRRFGEPARLAALRLSGADRPRVEGYRLTAMVRRAGPRLLASQLRGTIRRVRAGQARERVE